MQLLRDQTGERAGSYTRRYRRVLSTGRPERPVASVPDYRHSQTSECVEPSGFSLYSNTAPTLFSGAHAGEAEW